MYKTTLLVVNVIFEGHGRIIIKESCKSFDLQDSLAEREGFEPPVPLGTTVFKTVVIDHSTISPKGIFGEYLLSFGKRVQR